MIAVLQWALGLCDLAVVILTCVLATRLCSLRQLHAAATVFLVFVYVLLVAPCAVLSAANALDSQLGHLMAHLAIGLLLLRLSRRSVPAPHRSPGTVLPAGPARLLLRRVDLLVLTGSLCLAYLANAAIVIAVPQHTSDSLSYHLPRIMYWLANGNHRPYETSWIMQTSAPMASSLAMLWTILHTGSEHLVGFVQFLSVVGAACVVFGLARFMGYGRSPSLCAACIWLTLPIVVLQSTTAQNDMVAAFLMSASAFLFLIGMRTPSMGALAASSMALGSALATKSNMILFAPSFALLVAWVSARPAPGSRRRTAWWAALAILSVAVLAGPGYVQNQQAFGHPMGPLAKKSANYRPSLSLEGTCVNAVRYLFEAIDTTGLPKCVEAPVHEWLGRVGPQVFAVLGVDPNGPANAMTPSCEFRFYTPPSQASDKHWGPKPNRRYEEMAWMGPLGPILLMPLLVVNAVWFRARPGIRVQSILAWMGLLYFVAVSATLPWNPWSGRFMAIVAVLCVPLTAALFRPGYPLQAMTGALGVVVLWNTLLFSGSNPLLGSRAVWRSDYASRRSVHHPNLSARIRAIEELVPQDASVGNVQNRLEYVLFGRQLKRSVMKISLRPTGQRGVLLPSRKPDYIIVGHTAVLPQPFDAIQDYTQVGKGAWGSCYCRDDRMSRHEQRLFEKAPAVVLPPVIKVDAALMQHVRFRGQPRLGPWTEATDRFWIGSRGDEGFALDLLADRPAALTIAFDVAAGPSRRESERSVRFAVSAGTNTTSHIARFSGRGTLHFQAAIPRGASRLSFGSLDEADVPVLPNGDRRPLLIGCDRVSLVEAR